MNNFGETLGIFWPGGSHEMFLAKPYFSKQTFAWQAGTGVKNMRFRSLKIISEIPF